MTKPCAMCLEQGGKGRYDPAHSELIGGASSGGHSHAGVINERSYTCRQCGLEWIKETGSSGMGWVSFPPVAGGK